MTDYRTAVIGRWRDHLAAKPVRNNVIAMAVPLGELFDLAVDILTGGEGVPRVPTYDAALFAELRQTEPLDMEDVAKGHGFASLAVDRADPAATGFFGATFTLIDPFGHEHFVHLPSEAAEQHALATLAVAAAAREQEEESNRVSS